MTSPDHEVIQTNRVELKNDRVTLGIEPRGSFIRKLEIDGEELIYEPTLEDPDRGGIPVLGPTPGPIEGQRWKNLYPRMKQHGYDREVIWDIKEQSESSITLTRFLGPGEFLFNGQLEIDVTLLDNGVRISKTITNYEDKPREIGHALHPYFALNGGKFEFSQPTLAEKHPLTPKKSEILPGFEVIKFSRNDSEFEIRSNPKPIQTVIWSDKPELYEAIEPWWAKVGSGDIIDARSSKSYQVEIVKTK